MATLFISDLHLAEETTELTRLFLHFLQVQARRADALYILGDLFEVWLGDDDLSAYHQIIINALQQLSQVVPVYFMAGNRDFMIGQRFAIASGCRLLADPTLIDLYGEPTLLAHGDLLCTQDKVHILFRRLLQKFWLQRALLALPLAWRRRIGYSLRKQSKQRNQRLSDAMMDVNPTALQDIMRKYQVKQLIHGHTHKPSIHYFYLEQQPNPVSSTVEVFLNSQQCKRIVLNDWDESGSVLIYQPNHGMRLTTIAGAEQFI